MTGPIFVGNGHCDRCGTLHSPGYDLCPSKPVAQPMTDKPDAGEAARRIVVIRGNKWNAKSLSVCMAYDALRLSLGGTPSTFTPHEIVAWLACVAGIPIREGVLKLNIHESA